LGKKEKQVRRNPDLRQRTTKVDGNEEKAVTSP